MEAPFEKSWTHYWITSVNTAKQENLMIFMHHGCYVVTVVIKKLPISEVNCEIER